MNLRLRTRAALAFLLLMLSSCSSWEQAEDYEGWTLYVRSGETVSTDAFFEAVQPAFESVEEHMGPFREGVRVHAWNGGVDMADGTKGQVTGGDGEIAGMAGIGPARVRAFHARGDGGLFSLSGVFVGTADVGTAVHELVHAHLAENEERVPLWFEEGFAMVLGDGAMFEGEWVIDGLACWPWRELRKLNLTEEDLAPLLDVSSGNAHSVRDNVLVHFVGWAIVFDLYREVGVLDWELLLERYRQSPDSASGSNAMLRLKRTLRVSTTEDWLKRLRHEDPGVRLAAARGTWKLHSRTIQQILLAALRREKHPDVKASLAVNALATASQVRIGRRQSDWMWRSVFPVLRTVVLEDPEETTALRTLYRAYRYGNSQYDTQAALERLERFWQD